MRRIISILGLAALLVAALAAPAAGMTIADARQQPLGTVVTVEGFVTVPSGDFAASTFDQGFAIQDDTAGIYVSVPDNPNLNFNRRVEVSGAVDDDGFGQLVLRPAGPGDVVELPGASLVPTTPFATGSIGEATEGLLVEVSGTVTRPVGDDLPFGYSVFIDDGSGETQVFIPATTGINPFRIPWLEQGARIRVTGLSAQFLTQYEVLPRRRGDLQQGP